MNPKIAALFKKLKFCWWVLTNKEYQTNNEPVEAKEIIPDIKRVISHFKVKGLEVDNLDKFSKLAKIHPPDKILFLSDKDGKEYTFWECDGVTHALNNHQEVHEMVTQVLSKQNDAQINNS